MATNSSVLAWRIPWTEKPGRLQSMGSHRVGHDWSDLAAAAAAGCIKLESFCIAKETVSSVQISSVVQSCLTLCDPLNCNTPGFPVHHQLLELAQINVHWVSDAIQPSHPLSSTSPPAPNPSQHQSLFQWVNSSHEMAKGIHPAAAAAAKSLQSCPTLWDPMDCSLPGFSVHGILQVRTLEWVNTSFSNAWKWKVKVKSLSCVRLLATPWTAAYQAPPSMGFSRQQYWSGVPLPSPNTPWENHNSKRHMNPNVHCSTIYNSQDMETT